MGQLTVYLFRSSRNRIARPSSSQVKSSQVKSSQVKFKNGAFGAAAFGTHHGREISGGRAAAQLAGTCSPVLGHYPHPLLFPGRDLPSCQFRAFPFSYSRVQWLVVAIGQSGRCRGCARAGTMAGMPILRGQSSAPLAARAWDPYRFFCAFLGHTRARQLLRAGLAGQIS